MFCSQFGSSEILVTLLLITTLFFIPTLAAVSFILQVAVHVDRDAGWSARYAIFHQPHPCAYLGGKIILLSDTVFKVFQVF